MRDGRPRRWIRAIVALVLLLLSQTAAPQAHAHPHVWIASVATFVFEKGRIVALDYEWRFDELYGSLLIQEFDRNRDRRFDAGETTEIQAKAFSNLKEFNYFTALRAGSRSITLAGVENFSVSIEKGMAVYRFRLLLPEPVDPTQAAVALSVYDPSFYIEILFDKDDPVRFVGTPQPPCGFEIGEDKANPIYFGSVFPLRIALACEAGRG